MTNDEIIARCAPIRAVRQPLQCRRAKIGFRGPCWVTDPYVAVGQLVTCSPMTARRALILFLLPEITGGRR